MESATVHGSTLNSTTVNSIKQKHRKTIGNSKTSECLFCGLKHPFAKEKCPAYGKKCTKCGIKNLKNYRVHFVVFNDKELDCAPILGLSTSEKMKLVKVQHTNFVRVVQIKNYD